MTKTTDLPLLIFLAGFAGAAVAAAALHAAVPSVIAPLLLAVAAGVIGGYFWARSQLGSGPEVKDPSGTDDQLQALWETVVDGLVVIDERGIIKSVNPATLSIFGYSEDELVGQNVKILMPERYAREHDQYIKAYKRTGDGKIIGRGRKVSGRRKNGSEFPLYLAVSEFEVNGKRHFGGIARDVSAEELVQSLSAAKDAAETANESKTTFLKSMSHEIRTPLNAIMGFAQLLQFNNESDFTERDAQYINHIIESGDHLLELVNELLDLSQIESGRLSLSIEPVQVMRVMDECLVMLDPLATKNDIEVSLLAGDATDVALRADRVRLKQAIVNLVSNAIKYNQPGGSVTCALSQLDKDTLRIAVADTGVGIAPEQWDSLFEPFNRLGREASTIEGSGIGLCVTKTVIEAMGGQIGVYSAVGRGTCFWLDMPITEAAPILADQSAPSVRGTHKSVTGCANRARILYIEDNSANTVLMQRLLQLQSDFELVSVPTAEEGLDLIERERFDLILMDLNLPGMSGFEARAKLAQLVETRDIPVIAVSADINKRTIEHAKRVGFESFIKKPFDLDQTREAIVSTLQATVH